MTAFFVYDWIKGECLRPRMDCIKAAMTKDLVQFGNNGDGTYSDMSERAIALTPNGEMFMQPALAQFGDPLVTQAGTNVYGAIFNMKNFKNSDLAMLERRDPRSIENHTRCQNEEQAAVFRMQMSAAQQCAFAGATAMAHGKNADDVVTTVDLHDIQEALNYFTAIGNGHAVAMQAYNVGRATQLDPPPQGGLSHQAEAERLTREQNEVIDQIAAVDVQMAIASANGDQGTYNALLNQRNQLVARYNALDVQRLEQQRIIDRAQDVQDNARSAISRMNVLCTNMMAFSAVGLAEVIQNQDYIVGDGIHFIPPQRVPTRSEIEGNGAVSTGQPDTNLGDERWCRNGSTSPYFAARPRSAMRVLQGAGVCGEPSDWFTLPSFAQATRIFPTSVGQNFRFTTQGDASFARDGCVLISLATTPFFNNSTGTQQLMRGQRQYQALNVYREKSNHPEIYLVWSVMAQDNAFNTNASPPDGSNQEPGADPRQMADNPANAPPELEGNVLDCANADTSVDQRIRACRYNAVQIQFTSPLMFTERFPDPIPVPPPPVGDPDPPRPVPPAPPPPPPPPSH
jgi:hypothetical protein